MMPTSRYVVQWSPVIGYEEWPACGKVSRLPRSSRRRVDRVFPLEQAADAYRHNQEGRTRGKIVVTVDPDG